MRIRIDIDITPGELTAWLDSLAAPVSPTPEIGEIDRLKAEVARLESAEDDDGFADWPDDDIDFDLFDDPFAEAAPKDSFAAESMALDGLINWAKGRVKGGGNA